MVSINEIYPYVTALFALVLLVLLLGMVLFDGLWPIAHHHAEAAIQWQGDVAIQWHENVVLS